ncbi:MAG: CoA transferase [Rhodocyclaceae bacterium]|nr:CoA transferase [Rhodocyclaceae bacterium]
MLPLHDLRVLDLGWVWAGPMAACWMADLGAEVIKLEHSERLDNSRLRGAPIIDGRKMSIPGKSIELGPFYHNANRHKLSARLNLKHPRGAELFRALAAKSDVVIENFTPGTLAELGLDYASLARIKPDLVMVSLSTAGQSGPISDLRGYAPALSAYAGLDALVGYEGEPPSGMPNVGLNDPSSGAHAMLALLAALIRRDRTGQGQYIDLSQLEVGVAPLAEAALEYQFTGKVMQSVGNGHRLHCPHGIFPCAGDDRWVAVSVENERHWRALCAVMGEPEWADRDRYRDAAGRVAERPLLEAELARWTAAHTREAVVEQLVGAGVPATPVLTIEEQYVDPHLAARQLRQTTIHPLSGEERLYRLPWRMSAADTGIRGSAPQLGEHDDYVYGEILGLDVSTIRGLQQDRVIY